MQHDGQSMTKKEGYYLVKGESITMEKMHPYEPYRLELLPVIHSKCEEFLLLGYDKVSVDYFWDFLKNKKWKKTKEATSSIHQLVNDIMTVKMGEYIQYQTIEAFKDSEKNTVTDIESFRDLFS